MDLSMDKKIRRPTRCKQIEYIAYDYEIRTRVAVWFGWLRTDLEFL